MSVYGMFSTLRTQVYTLHALQSFFEHTPWNKGDHFLLIDNDASVDSALGKAFPEIEILRREKPVSFAENANTVLEHARERNTDAFLLNNDIIFTADWSEPLIAAGDVIACPLSNQQIQYENKGWKLEPAMDLRESLGHEQQLQRIVKDHAAQVDGFKSMLSLPFFCVRIPQAAYEAIGDFDPGFGPGGGEDRDYALRAALKDIPVGFALQSFVLHFQGKSTWRGSETPEMQRARESVYLNHFQSKWGQKLLELVILKNEEILQTDPQLPELLKNDQVKDFVRLLIS